MIWFACKQCGAVHNRPDSSAGAYIFCDCGAGLTVPWESTAEPREAPPLAPAASVDPAAPPPRLPQLEPIPIDEQRVPPRPRREAERYDEPPRRPSTWDDRPRPRRNWGRRRRDPRYCFNHEEAPSEKPCSACGEPFCGACLVALRGKTLCAPCKNFRVKRLHNPPRVSGMAITSLIIAMLSGPLALCVWFLSLLLGTPIVNLLGLVPQVFALLIAISSLRVVETNPRISGRSLAITALVTAVVAGSMSILLAIFGGRLAA